MNYIFKGSIRGMLCSDCEEPLSNVKVRLYRLQDRQYETHLAVAAQKETFREISEEEIRAKENLLIAETTAGIDGNFEFALGGNTDGGYNGSAFEVDIYCGSVPRRFSPTPPPPPRRFKPRQFSITTIQPLWNQSSATHDNAQQYYAHQFVIESNFYCQMLRLFGLYVVCGRIVNCKDKVPVRGLRVEAFDVDLIQDDPLGSATTDEKGKFCIWYTEEDFSKTIFSWLNIEWPAGPDIYFKVYSGSLLLLEEPREKGRTPGRGNSPNCLCVGDLCVDFSQPPVDTEPEVLAFFTHVGVYRHATQINSAAGANGKTVTGPFSFFNTLRLNGAKGKKLNGQPQEYKFQFTSQFDLSGEPINWTDVTPAQMGRMKIGILQKYTFSALPFPIYTDTSEDYFVLGNPGERTAGITADNWIQVPQETGNPLTTGNFVPNDNLIGLDTTQLPGVAFPDVNLDGQRAGMSSADAGIALAQNRIIAVRMLAREAGNNATIVQAGNCRRLSLNNYTYNNVLKHESWGGVKVSEGYGACMVDIEELRGPGAGCSRITNTLRIHFSAVSPDLGSATLTMQGPGGTINFALPPITPDYKGTIDVNTVTPVAGLEPCAYIVRLRTGVQITTGDDWGIPHEDEMAFCK